MSEWIKKINWKYVIVMLIGNVILGLGIAIFKLSGLGMTLTVEWLWHCLTEQGLIIRYF